ncbi:MAG: peptidyl-prolyl cis-trans isomerase, cyclophilin-type [Phenylobacterium sp.]|uniref:peptidylprolyl isomerase n=1 Tax=Phenylobacterium sp. TaxID=1871053 RepID=UPI0026132838|nr:peptidylprolyl isomerase [Phenylobacterium sp.]MDB5497963.1 peptidyl-prolyl cis-trans isomerase, cyclophilin-type [Phenylobacterium sp.]
MRRIIEAGAIALAALACLGAARPQPDWRALDPADTLVIETSKGRIVVEMQPLLAPKAVERVKRLAREGVYDGLLFHRVIEGFVDQTGNPNNRDGGTSAYPDLPAEFSARLPPQAGDVVVLERSDAVEGFLGSTPISGASATEQALGGDHRRRVWGAYCAGVAGMGRQAGIDTANSEIFFMRAPARRLDHDYAVWGRVVQGLEVVRAIAVGEPPADPDRMVRVRLAAELPAAERPRLEVANERGPAFRARVAQLQARLGARFSVCDVPIPIRQL